VQARAAEGEANEPYSGAREAAPVTSGVNIRERLEHEALHSTDARSRLAALRELRLLNESGGAGETPDRPQGFTLPWPPRATSALVFYYDVAQGTPTDLDPDQAFIVHRGQMNNPDKPSIVVFPLPPEADERCRLTS
jgi:hypothetical protein